MADAPPQGLMATGLVNKPLIFTSLADGNILAYDAASNAIINRATIPATAGVDSIGPSGSPLTGTIDIVSPDGSILISVSSQSIQLQSSSGATTALETELTTTGATTIVTKTPSAVGLYLVMAYFRVVTAATSVTLALTYTDATGAQTYTWVSAVSEAVGSYTMIPQFIYSTTAAITVTATAGTASQVYVSAAILGI